MALVKYMQQLFERLIMGNLMGIEREVKLTILTTHAIITTSFLDTFVLSRSPGMHSTLFQRPMGGKIARKSSARALMISAAYASIH